MIRRVLRLVPGYVRLGVLLLAAVVLFNSCAESVPSAQAWGLPTGPDDVYVDAAPSCRAVAVVGPGAIRWDQVGPMAVPGSAGEVRTEVMVSAPDDAADRSLASGRSWRWNDFPEGSRGWLTVSMPPADWSAAVEQMTGLAGFLPVRWMEVAPSDYPKRLADCSGLKVVIKQLKDPRQIVVLSPSADWGER